MVYARPLISNSPNFGFSDFGFLLIEDLGNQLMIRIPRVSAFLQPVYGYYFIPCELFKTAPAGGLLQESKWQQVFLGFLDPSEYSRRS